MGLMFLSLVGSCTRELTPDTAEADTDTDTDTDTDADTDADTDTDTDADSDTDSDTDTDTDTDTEPDPPLTLVATVSESGSKGQIATVAVAPPWTVTENALPGSADVTLRRRKGHVFVLDREADEVRVYGAANIDVVKSTAVLPTGADPMGTDMCGTDVVVSLASDGSLRAHAVSTGLESWSVDLSAETAPGETDGNPDPGEIAAAGPSVVVALRQTQGGSSMGGALVKVDCASHDVTERWVRGPNPRVFPNPYATDAVIVLTGEEGAIDGELGLLDLLTGTYTTRLTEASAGGDIVGVAVDRLGQALVAVWDGTGTDLVCMNIISGSPSPLGRLATRVVDLGVDDIGQTWVAGNRIPGDGSSAGGLRVFDVPKCTEVTSDWISTTHPPRSLAFKQ